MLHYLIALAVTLANPTPDKQLFAGADVDKGGKNVHVYQTPNRTGSLTIQSVTKKVISFFLFNTDGELVFQTRLEKAAQLTVESLPAGLYTFHALGADEKVKGGKIEIKKLNQ